MIQPGAQDDVVDDMEALQSDDNGLVFDPDQDVGEKREIRRCYRELQDDESLLNSNAVKIDSLMEKLYAANQLFSRVKDPNEARLDSKLLVTTSTIGVLKARRMRTSIGGFDVDDFVANLATFMGGNRITKNQQVGNEEMDIELDEDVPLDWDLIGRKVMAKSRRVPVLDFMLGPLSIERKKRARIGRVKFDREKEEEKRPQELTEQDIVKSKLASETTRNILTVHRVLTEQEGPVNLFRLIVNPDSFGQSVENLFYVSFLIREAQVNLVFDNETSEPLLCLADAPTLADYLEGTIKKQMIMELDVEIWKRAKEVFNITQPMIPTCGNA